jgi:hypothetical protein
VFSPDQIWLTILQGVSQALAAQHAASRRSPSRPRIPRAKAGQIPTASGALAASPTSIVRWSEWLTGCLDGVGDASVRDWLITFSTSSGIDTATQRIMLLDIAYQQFQAEERSICGIPCIKVRGTPEDWRKMREKVHSLRSLGVEGWPDELAQVLGKFAAAAEGESNKAHWQELYKLQGGSGGPYITGWITGLYPFVRSVRLTRGAHGPALETYDRPRREVDSLTSQHFPNQRSSLLVRVSDAAGSSETDACARVSAGFLGIAQDRTTGAVTPTTGWAVSRGSLSRLLLEGAEN